MTEKKESILIYKTAPEWIEYAKSLPDPEMLFDTFWFEGELSFLFSDTGAGKTIIDVQIAQSIAAGEPIHEDIKMTAQAQKVFLCEFELSPKQFESRYKNKLTGTHYQLSDNLIRAELDLTKFQFNRRNKLEDEILFSIRHDLIETEAKILIVDNVTFIEDIAKIEQAIEFMRNLNILKKELGLSILVIGHTTKRNLIDPITQNSMGGSKKLMDLADSSFTIGRSSQGETIRYLKQIKVRQDAFKYGSENILLCEITKDKGFLSFQMNGYGKEFSHLSKPNPKEKRNLDIIEAIESGEYTQKELAEMFGITDRTIRRVKEDHFKNQIEDDLSF